MYGWNVAPGSTVWEGWEARGEAGGPLEGSLRESGGKGWSRRNGRQSPKSCGSAGGDREGGGVTGSREMADFDSPMLFRDLTSSSVCSNYFCVPFSMLTPDRYIWQ